MRIRRKLTARHPITGRRVWLLRLQIWWRLDRHKTDSFGKGIVVAPLNLEPTTEPPKPGGPPNA
jgi:hypothetical protein